MVEVTHDSSTRTRLVGPQEREYISSDSVNKVVKLLCNCLCISLLFLDWTFLKHLIPGTHLPLSTAVSYTKSILHRELVSKWMILNWGVQMKLRVIYNDLGQYNRLLFYTRGIFLLIKRIPSILGICENWQIFTSGPSFLLPCSSLLSVLHSSISYCQDKVKVSG